MAIYLTDEEMLEGLKRHAAGDSNLLGSCALRLADGMHRYLKRGGYFGLDDEVVRQEVVLIILEKAPKFDYAKSGKPFSYFTSVALNHIRQLARKKQLQDRTLAGFRGEFIRQNEVQQYRPKNRVVPPEMTDEWGNGSRIL
jgi:DNA-directed RNA polymerase specialized sigma24 family protein